MVAAVDCIIKKKKKELKLRKKKGRDFIYLAENGSNSSSDLCL